jgi:hypothetical protein
MNDEVLDVLAYKAIEEFGKKKIAERRARQFLKEQSIDQEKLREMLPKEQKPFDIAEVRSETHLREIVMERVLDTAAHNVSAAVVGGPSVPLAELPEELQAQYLNKLMLDVLDSNSGPGPILRQIVALTILNYRMRNRLRETQSALPPSSSKFQRLEQGIAYIEKQIKFGMFYFETWTFFADGPGEGVSDLAKKKMVERLLRRESLD